MKIIITGATSFLGKSAADLFEQKGHEVWRLRHSIDPDDLILLPGLKDGAPEEEKSALPAACDAFLHFAWGGRGSEGRSSAAIQEQNIEMSLRALRKAKELGCRKFLFAGSQAEYGGVHTQYADRKQHEDDPCFPVSEYGKAKLCFGQLGAAECAGSGMEFLHLRYFSVYGPGDHGTSLVSTAVRNFLADAPMEFGDCGQDWNYLFLTDASLALERILEKGTAGVYNVASKDTRRLKDFILAMKEVLGSASPLAFGTRPANAEGTADLRPDTAKLEALGFREEISFDEGIRICSQGLN